MENTEPECKWVELGGKQYCVLLRPDGRHWVSRLQKRRGHEFEVDLKRNGKTWLRAVCAAQGK